MSRLLAALLVCAAISHASAALLFYDSFNYSSGSLGTVGAPTWVKQGTTADPAVTGGGGLTYPGLQTSSDSVALQYDGSGLNSAAGVDGTALSGQPYISGTLFYSMLMKVTAVQVTGGNGFATGGNLTSGSFMAGLETLAPGAAPTTGNSAAPLLIRSGDGTQFSSTYQLGTAKTATAADRQFYTGQSFSTGAGGDTVFVVLKYSFDSVNGDSASMFINPTPGSAEPAAQLTVSAGTALTLGSGIQSFFVRNNSVEPDTLLVDELRVGTTWADVTPAVVPEPGTIVLFLLGAITTSFLARRKR